MRLGTLLYPALLALSGCSLTEALQRASSGYVGCSAGEIEITNDEAGFNQRSWDATCRGHLFHCSGMPRVGMSCAPDGVATTSAAVATKPGPSSAEAEPHAWRRFVARDCGLTVSLPGPPEESRPRARTKGGSITGYAATVDLGAEAVSMGCFVLPRDQVASETNLEGARDGALKEIGGSIEAETEIEVGDFSGKDVRFEAGVAQGRMRVLRRGREVVWMVMLPTPRFSSPEVKAFFETLAPEPGYGDPMPQSAARR